MNWRLLFSLNRCADDVPFAARRWLAVWALLAWVAGAGAATVTIDGAQTYQVIDGFGVNANHRSWKNDELKPVVDALIDQAGMTLFRLVFDNADWELTNDNANPNLMNWDYYQTVYSSPDFQKMWDMMRYLNQKGIVSGLMPNFQGFAPDWMGFQNLTPGFENEWAEMITSALVYARYSNHLQFTLVGPNNEPDIPGVGVGVTGNQYVTTLHQLALQLNASGLGDLRFVGPDRSQSGTIWLPEIMSDPLVMSKLAHFGMHSYASLGSGSEGVSDFIQQSAYPGRTFWMTEFNVWCEVCQSGGAGTNSWLYSRSTAEYLLYHLANNASAGLLWEGYDSIYFNTYNNDTHWSFWGLFALDDTNAALSTYTPRKSFYTVAQISRFVRPGARRIDLSGAGAPLTLAFYHAASGQVTLTGVNTDGATVLSGTLTNLPAITNLDLYYTDAANNLRHSASVPVDNGQFNVTVPADCVFTLTGPNGGSNSLDVLVTLTTNGHGKIFPEPGKQLFTAGQSYTFVAVPDSGQAFAGWTGSVTSSSPRLTVALTTNLALEAAFVPGTYSPAKGTYQGLFYETGGPAAQRSGFVTIRTTTKGRFSGQIQSDTGRYAISGVFDEGGHSVVTVARRNQSPLTIELQLDLAGAGGVLGTVTDGQWLAPLSGQRSGFDGGTAGAPAAGRYTIVISGNRASTLEPGGDSYGTATVDSAGRVRLACSLADGSKASQSVAISSAGEVPLYLSLYGNKGSLSGWILFTNAPAEDVSGGLSWIKPGLSKGKLYPGGFSMQATVSGSRYVPPAKGKQIIELSKADLVLQGGTSLPASTNQVTLGTDNRVTNLGGNKLSLSFNSGSGLFKGSLVHPSQPKPIPFGGAVLQKRNLGRGYFANGDQTGRVLFEASPAAPAP